MGFMDLVHDCDLYPIPDGAKRFVSHRLHGMGIVRSFSSSEKRGNSFQTALDTRTLVSSIDCSIRSGRHL